MSAPRIDRWNSLTGRERAELVKQCVEYVLDKYPNSRNSDLYLTILALRYCTQLGKNPILRIERVVLGTPPGSRRRLVSYESNIKN